MLQAPAWRRLAPRSTGQRATVPTLGALRSMIASISMKRGAVIAHGNPRKSSLTENVGAK
jgi:hypothetical protein